MKLARTSVQIPVGDAELPAEVVVPDGAGGVVVFAHGSGSGRHSPRNQFVATRLLRAGLATVLADLLTETEERVDASSGEFRFAIEMLGQRVVSLVDWTSAHEAVAGLPLGCFGASTGAAAALIAAAADPDRVRTVVSRGGRPDLAGQALHAVHQPVLLLVGGRDDVVLDLNRTAQRSLGGPSELVVIPGAGHLFEEHGALEHVANTARDWLLRHFGRAGDAGSPGLVQPA